MIGKDFVRRLFIRRLLERERRYHCNTAEVKAALFLTAVLLEEAGVKWNGSLLKRTAAQTFGLPLAVFAPPPRWTDYRDAFKGMYSTELYRIEKHLRRFWDCLRDRHGDFGISHPFFDVLYAAQEAADIRDGIKPEVEGGVL